MSCTKGLCTEKCGNERKLAKVLNGKLKGLGLWLPNVKHEVIREEAVHFFKY